MRLSHARPVVAARFDDPNLVSAAGLVPIVRLAQAVGLAELVDERLTVPSDKGANAGGKVTALVAGMVAGADSIDDMALLRHDAMRRIFDQPYAPSTLGSFLRAFSFGHVRQLDAVASRFLTGLAQRTPLLPAAEGRVLVDVDDTIIEVHGHAKQGAGFGYTGVRGLNALLATVTTDARAPVIVAQRLRKRSCGSPRGAQRLVRDALATVRSLRPWAATGTVVGEPDHPAVRGLPRAIHVPGRDGHPPPWLEPLVDALTTEAFDGGLGSDLVMARLSDALLIRALRHHGDAVAKPGWLAGPRDPYVAAALAAVHADPARPWDLGRSRQHGRDCPGPRSPPG